MTQMDACKTGSKKIQPRFSSGIIHELYMVAKASEFADHSCGACLAATMCEEQVISTISSRQPKAEATTFQIGCPLAGTATSKKSWGATGRNSLGISAAEMSRCYSEDESGLNMAQSLWLSR